MTIDDTHVYDTTEEWRDVIGAFGYEVSNLGRVRSIECMRPMRRADGIYTLRRHSGKILRRKMLNKRINYPLVNICGRWRLVHRLVIEAFVGPPPTGHECRHLNGNPQDARLVNLAWGTHTENMHDMIEHGTRQIGEKNSSARLTEAAVVQIFDMYISGHTQVQIARDLGVSPARISEVINRKSWAHVAVSDETVKACKILSSLNGLRVNLPDANRFRKNKIKANHDDTR